MTSVTPLAGPFVIAVVLMTGAGVVKTFSPAGTSGALAALGLPHRRALVRVGGALEAVVGLGALATGNAALAASIAMSYAAFAGFVFAARRADTPVSSCGCLGRVDTPPHAIHIALDLCATVVVSVVAISGGLSLHDIVDAQPWSGIPFLVLVGIGLGLASAVMSVLPRTLRAAKEVL